MGTGRSGTSLVAGTLARSGYWTGAGHWKARDTNPKGFFEDREVNAINEALLSTVTPTVPPGLIGTHFPGRLGDMQRWLAALPPGVEPRADSRCRERIQRVIDHESFALKDPRFCFTLPIWREYLPADTVFIVVFREPSRTITSMTREINSQAYLRSVRRSPEQLELLWQRSYQRVLDHYEGSQNWIVLHYEQVVAGDLDRLGALLGTTIDDGFADENLRRSPETSPVQAATTKIYDRLNELARYHAV